jgi:hypothetical protein
MERTVPVKLCNLLDVLNPVVHHRLQRVEKFRILRALTDILKTKALASEFSLQNKSVEVFQGIEEQYLLSGFGNLGVEIEDNFFDLNVLFQIEERNLQVAEFLVYRNNTTRFRA